jgi:MoaA/NifB/PqqE/SkfB family radical SAM enzyme
MFVQIEITTLCNYHCFYCAGRSMAQRHMEWTMFEPIVSHLPRNGCRVSLQGEGEPLLHPLFWQMVEYTTRHGFLPYTITNGSRIDAARLASHLPKVGISIDTTDPDEAERMGRHKLDKVLANLDALISCMGPQRIVIHTVDYGQPLDALAAYLKERGLHRHLIQPLQTKDDYARRYPGRVASPTQVPSYRCGYLRRRSVRYFNIDGIELPCCFIKDTKEFTSAQQLRRELAQRKVPGPCTGCRELFKPVATTARNQQRIQHLMALSPK